MENKKRIRSLDILRGLAILGTLGTNIWLFTYLGCFLQAENTENCSEIYRDLQALF
ncbi:hypothetical protein [Priestia megaterium]|uniref:hypothetical protein n=1 Tax=Priestia megaterium TaxID=1404 RepID=UPI002D81117D|nr:hypothetical protein [Priestia megaterium]MEB4860611.1 hypothetical protein [Priestia megaterium]